ncbi:MAG: glycosyltransferase family 2 protein [Armatimonadota bacterium]
MNTLTRDSHRVSLMIPTKDRPRELADAVASIVIQTRQPEELIIVDDGAMDLKPVEAQLAGSGIELKYHRKNGTPGLTASRNIGIGLSTGDLIVFLDDDVVLEPEYVASLVEIFDLDPKIGGVGGIITNEPVSKSRLLATIIRGTPYWGHGRVFRCGLYQENYLTVRQPQDVQYLHGGVSSYRRQVFDEFSFHEGFRGYCSLEDTEFSYRVGLKYRLMITPKARLAHMRTPTARIDEYALCQQEIANLWYHFHRNMPQRPLNKLALWWFYSATLLMDVASLVVRARSPQRMRSRLRGHWEGLRDCVRAGVPPPAGTEGHSNEAT